MTAPGFTAWAFSTWTSVFGLLTESTTFMSAQAWSWPFFGLISILSSWPELTPFWAAVLRAFAIVAIMSARGMPFSFSMYSRTERISLLIWLECVEKKSGPQGPL